jgi:DNA (cytosine-5)-methyltransferase 1
MSKLTFIDLFAGIGGMRIPFENLGGTCVFSSEWDKHARQTYVYNFDETPAGDITQINEAGIPDHDILLAGFPCQPCSIIGDKQGFGDTRGTLFFDIARILKQKQPTAFLLENVKQLLTHDKGRTFAVISVWHENKGGNISVLPFSCALRAGASYNYLFVNGVRRPSNRELLRLQGFPEDFKIVGNVTQVRRQIGNSVAIPVVHAIAEKMLQALEQHTTASEFDNFFTTRGYHLASVDFW